MPRPYLRGKGLVTFDQSLRLINIDCFPQRIFQLPIILQKTICGCNTGNPWLLLLDDIAIFLVHKLVCSYAYSKLWIFNEARETLSNVIRPSTRGWGLVTLKLPVVLSWLGQAWASPTLACIPSQLDCLHKFPWTVTSLSSEGLPSFWRRSVRLWSLLETATTRTAVQMERHATPSWNEWTKLGM